MSQAVAIGRRTRRGASRVAANRVRTARIYDAPGSRDGTRVLIMRLWPRGIRKSRVDRWFKDLGPSLPLLRAIRGGKITWAQYRRRYLAEMAAPAARAPLDEVRALARRGPVTLLCSCPDDTRCHRSLLRAYLSRGQPFHRQNLSRRGG